MPKVNKNWCLFNLSAATLCAVTLGEAIAYSNILLALVFFFLTIFNCFFVVAGLMQDDS